MVQFKAISRLQTPEQMMDVFRKNTGTFQKEVLKDRKRALVATVLGGEEGGALRLTEADVEELFAPM